MVSSSVWIHAYILCTTQLPYYLSFFNGKKKSFLYLMILTVSINMTQVLLVVHGCFHLEVQKLSCCAYTCIWFREENRIAMASGTDSVWHMVTYLTITSTGSHIWADFKQENCVKNSGSVKVNELQVNCIWSCVTSILSFIVQLINCSLKYLNCSNSCREQKVLSEFLYADIWMQGWGSISTHVDKFIFSY